MYAGTLDVTIYGYGGPRARQRVRERGKVSRGPSSPCTWWDRALAGRGKLCRRRAVVARPARPPVAAIFNYLLLSVFSTRRGPVCHPSSGVGVRAQHRRRFCPEIRPGERHFHGALFLFHGRGGFFNFY